MGMESVGILSHHEVRVPKGFVGYGKEGRTGFWTRGEKAQNSMWAQRTGEGGWPEGGADD